MDSTRKYITLCKLHEYSHCLKITQNVEFNFLILAFSTNFCPIKADLSGNTVWPQAFKNTPKWTIFGIFIWLLSTQNENVASLAMLNETFAVIFKQRALCSVIFVEIEPKFIIRLEVN